MVAPGLAWSDWMIAAELAAALGAQWEFTAVGDVTDQIAAVVQGFSGISSNALAQPATRDGVVLGSTAAPTTAGLLDPMATPGMVSAEEFGLGSYAGIVRGEEQAQAPTSGAGAPSLTTSLSSGENVISPALDNYSLRIVGTHTLYDNGANIVGSPSLSALRKVAVAMVNPYDLDRLGLATGDKAKLRSGRATIILPVEADAGVLRGTVVLNANVTVHGAERRENPLASLVDSSLPVNDVVLESL